MEGFKTLRRKGVQVSGGDRVAVGTQVIEVGGAAETVNVTAEAALVQSQSGERSFAVTTTQVENLPVNHANFTSLTSLVPGVVSGGASAGGTRLGGAGQNNIMMDGVSAMDTGNNGQMLAMNIESIGEVKILTQGYQAEYGRSSGLQITAVTKSGTNQFRGSAYDLLTDSDWNANSWVNERNGDAKPKSSTQDARLHHRRSGREAGRQQQAVLLLRARIPPDDDRDQRRQSDPDEAPDRARARRRLLAVGRQQRPAVSVREGSQLLPAVCRRQHRGLLSGGRRGRPDSGQLALRARARGPQPLPGAQRHAGAGHPATTTRLPRRRWTT